MDILIFDVKGKFAHFRKFYTNSSSLSYSIPPRTSIQGMIAAILGMERDSYYNELSKDILKITVRKLTKTYKIMQTVNYIKVTSPKNLIEPEDHTQIPFEMITSDGFIKYRIYLSSENKELLDNIENRIKNNSLIYTPYLGAASFNCSINYVDRIIGKEVYDERYINIITPIKLDYIKERGIDISRENLFLIKEKMPADFLEERIIKEVNSYIYDENGGAISAKLKVPFVKLAYKEIEENILFM